MQVNGCRWLFFLFSKYKLLLFVIPRTWQILKHKLLIFDVYSFIGNGPKGRDDKQLLIFYKNL